MEEKSIEKRDCKHTDSAIIPPRGYKYVRTYTLAPLFDTIEMYGSPSAIAHAIWKVLEYVDPTRGNAGLCIDGDVHDLLCELADAFADMTNLELVEIEDDDE